MTEKHSVIVIPGLGNETRAIFWAVDHWRRHHLQPIVYPIEWYNKEKEFSRQLQLLVELIDRLIFDEHLVSLVGCSAGGSAALNAFVERRSVIHRVVNVCGRLRRGNHRGFRSFEARTVSSPIFAKSVKLFEHRENTLSHQDRKRVMTIHALFGDELVPPDTAILRNAYNIVVPTPEHMLSIAAALTVFSHPLITFLTQENKLFNL